MFSMVAIEPFLDAMAQISPNCGSMHKEIVCLYEDIFSIISKKGVRKWRLSYFKILFLYLIIN